MNIPSSGLRIVSAGVRKDQNHIEMIVAHVDESTGVEIRAAVFVRATRLEFTHHRDHSLLHNDTEVKCQLESHVGRVWRQKP